MATIKLYFDNRKSKNDPNKKVQVKLAVNHRSSSTYIVLGVAVLPSQWDAQRLQVKDHPDKMYLNTLLKKKVSDAEMTILRLSEQEQINTMSSTELRTRIEEAINGPKVEAPKKPKENPNTVAKWFKRFVERKTGRTKGIYEATYCRLEAWLGADKLEKLTFEDIKISFLEDFNDFLAKTNKANSIAIHMRNLRAVVNYAIDNEITTTYAFRRFKIKTEATRKRNFDVDTLRHIFNADVEPWMERYRDFFKLSFMLLGINTVDLCNLKEVKNGRVEYVRSKTHKLYDVKVYPEALEIIERYRGVGQLLNYLDTTQHYRSFNSRLTYGLKKMRQLLNEGCEEEDKIDTLSMYWARHSWATIAASLDIPKETIAAALGHSSHSVTDIYIEFDMRKVDEANRKVLDYVLYGVIPNAPKKRGRPKKA